MTNIMSTTVRYALVALLTFAATFGYFKFTEKKTPVDPPKKDKIKTYPITQFFQTQTLALIDSAVLIKEQKLNIEFLGNLIEAQNALYNDFAKLSPCGNGSSPSDCVFEIESGCYPCTKCCLNRFFRRNYDPKPNDYRIAAFDKMNLRLFNNGQELTLASSLSNGIRIFTVPGNTAFDRVTIDLQGSHQISAPR
jgi:hypothetical protein